MTGFTWVDAVVLVGVLVVAVAGWRAGVIATAAAFAGFIGGAMVGAWLVPQLLAEADLPALLDAGATVAGMVLLGMVGQAVLGLVGRIVRDALDFRPVRLLDSASGLVVSAIAFLVSAWLVLSVGASVPHLAIGDQIRASRAYVLLEETMSGPGARILDDARTLLAGLDLPSIPLNPATLPPLEGIDQVDVPEAVVDVARASVLQVSASSTRCSAAMVGSAVVVGPERVATNAHVIAGASRITVRTVGGVRDLGARLIHRDAATDLAILFVPGLRAPVPAWDREAPRGTAAAVAGFPRGGPLRVRPALIRGQATIDDDSGSGTRRVHVLQGLVEPGNSGGPVLDLDGEVIGLVFANSALDDRTGFALAPEEVLPAVESTRTSTDEVSSGSCPAS